MKDKELNRISSERIDRVPEVPYEEIKWLWHHGYYDGIIDGLIEYKGKQYWALMSEECEHTNHTEDEDCPFFRKYIIIKLTRKQLDYRKYWHQLFEEQVGTHCNYIDGRTRNITGMKPANTHAVFYAQRQAKWVEPDYTRNTLVGKFTT